jgi:hypothetical protein
MNMADEKTARRPARSEPDPADGAQQDAEAPDPRDAEIARLRSELEAAGKPVTDPGPGAVQLRVTAPAGGSMQFAHTKVGPDWTDVPAGLVPALMQAADTAGVTIEQQEGSG